MRLITIITTCFISSLSFISCDNKPTYNVDFSFDDNNSTASVIRGNYKGDIVIPDIVKHNGKTYKVVSIEDEVFFNNTELTSVTIQNGIKKIGDKAFGDCDHLSSILLPASIEKIGKSVFIDCDGLKEIIVDEKNKHLSSLDGVLFNKDKSILIKYPAKKETSSYSIPEGVEIIPEDGFNSCIFLREIVIPKTLKDANAMFLWGCRNLNVIKCYAVTPPKISTDSFEYVSYKINIYVPKESIETYKTSLVWKSYKNYLPIE